MEEVGKILEIAEMEAILANNLDIINQTALNLMTTD
jgi:hypothetical protein